MNVMRIACHKPQSRSHGAPAESKKIDGEGITAGEVEGDEQLSINKIFLAISALFGLVPGISIMWKGIGTPPPPSYAFLFGGIIEAFGSLALILLWMNRDRIKSISPRKVVWSAIILGAASFLALGLYLVLFNLCVVSHPTHHTVLFPLWTSGDLAILVTKAGSRYGALDRYGYFGVYDAIAKMPFYVIPVTVALLLLVYQSIFTALATAFGLVGFHKDGRIEAAPAAVIEPPATGLSLSQSEGGKVGGFRS